MRRKIVNILLAACLTAGMAVGSLPTASLGVKAAADLETIVDQNFNIRESDINQLLTGDLILPTTIEGLEGATIAYSLDKEDEEYAKVEEVDGKKVLKVTRPKAGDKDPDTGKEDRDITLKAVVTSADGQTYETFFPFTVRAGLSDDSYAGYVYVCFADTKNPATSAHEYTDVQQVHFFLSEDGLNWTALNGFNPIFKTGSDYADSIESCGPNSVNYKVAEGTDVEATTKGDATVLFPFEGDDQGIRDPYLIRGCKKDGSDSNKVWLLATDLNTHSTQYHGNKENNTLAGDTWGLTSTYGVGSTSLFVYETEDWVHWERRYIDVGSEIGACMAWAPEAIYNPVKDNYLVYWSARVDADGSARDRLYCNETKDFKTFGPTKLYEQEPFYKNYGKNGRGGNSGYGNIDTSQLWVAGMDDNGEETPYGTLYRLVKDETNNHIELMKADSVLDPKYEGEQGQAAYDATKANAEGITPFTLDGVSYGSKADLAKLTGDTNQIKTADIVYNWFKDQSVGNHFTKIENKEMESKIGAYEGATMFKFIDRDEWCIMIDFYGDMSVRYEPYTTTDLDDPNSIKKLASGYGRTGGDVGCHGGMIPITVKEYNTLIDTYNADPSVDNYHPIDYISVDTRSFEEKAQELKAKLDAAAATNNYSDGVKTQMKNLVTYKLKGNETTEDLNKLIAKWSARADKLLNSKIKNTPVLRADTVTIVSNSPATICTKATDGLKTSVTVKAEANVDSETSKITFKSSNIKVATVDKKKGVVKAKKAGTVTITATAPGGAKATCKVTVKGIPSKITLNKKTVTLKKGKTFQIAVTLPKGTVCSKFTYKSNKSKIAAVSKTGKVTAKKKGTAKITVTAANNKKAKATITVKVK